MLSIEEQPLTLISLTPFLLPLILQWSHYPVNGQLSRNLCGPQLRVPRALPLPAEKSSDSSAWFMRPPGPPASGPVAQTLYGTSSHPKLLPAPQQYVLMSVCGVSAALPLGTCGVAPTNMPLPASSPVPSASLARLCSI